MPDFDPNAAFAEGGVFGLPHAPEEALTVLVPVPFEATVSYGDGTANAPAAILAASRQVDLHDVETGAPWEPGIAMLPDDGRVRAWSDEARRLAEPVIARGGAVEGDAGLERALGRVNAICGELNGWLRGEVERWLEAGKVVGTVGGDHGCVYGAIAAHAARYPGMGILHVDAHSDLRRAYEGFEWSHASIMDNVCRFLPEVERLVQVGVRDLCEEERERIDASGGRVSAHFDAELSRRRLEGETWGAQARAIVSELPGLVYVSFDVDGLDPALCPHTGTPVPGGLGFQEATYLLGAVVRSGRRIVGFDLCEVAPGPDGDEWDANVGARVLYKLIGWTLESRRRAGIA